MKFILDNDVRFYFDTSNDSIVGKFGNLKIIAIEHENNGLVYLRIVYNVNNNDKYRQRYHVDHEMDLKLGLYFVYLGLIRVKIIIGRSKQSESESFMNLFKYNADTIEFIKEKILDLYIENKNTYNIKSSRN